MYCEYNVYRFVYTIILNFLCRQEAAIIDGSKIAIEIQEELKAVVDTCVNAGQKRPKLVAILVGNHPSSKAYIGKKMKAAKVVGKYIFDSDK